MLADHYVETRIMSTLRRDNDLIDIVTFRLLNLRSCLCEEFRSRFFSKPNKEWTFSVFQGRDSKLDALEIKRSVKKNMQVFRIQKHVSWTGLPPIEDDDKKVKKVMKDAPKGAEDLNTENNKQELIDSAKEEGKAV